MKVLVADDTQEVRKYLFDVLSKEGYETHLAENGEQAIQLFHSDKPDFICLDIMMPDISGYDVCKEIRKADSDIPILLLSSKSQPFDKILGLELGADDYIVKPFDIGELIARIRAITRRCMFKKAPENSNESFKMKHIEVFPNQLRANVSGEVIDLSLREIKILSLLNNKKNTVVTRDDLLDHCWGEHITTESRTVDFHISKLRKRVEKDPHNPTIIKTVHGVGYRFDTQ